MLKGFKYRIYPTKEQVVLLESHFGAVRLLWNLALDVRKYAYSAYGITTGYHELATVQLRALKEEFEFFKEVNSQSLQASLKNLDTAYQRFFKGQADFPRFKRKDGKQSFVCPQNFSVEKGKLWLPKFKDGIEIILHRKLKGIAKSATISKTPSGKYFVSILCETQDVKPVKKDVDPLTSIGIDLGLKSFIVTSEGLKVDCPKYLRESERKLIYLQRQVSKKKKGSKRRNLARIKLARQHEKVANQRKDFLHKLSTEITNLYDTCCFETLNVKGMTKNHKLAKSINDAGWAEFLRMVEYKEEWKGGSVLKIGTFEPSTKVCHKCWHVNHNLTLADREWDCPHCGAHLDRDENAAIVIKMKCLYSFFGLREPQFLDAEVCDPGAAVDSSKVSSDMDEGHSCLVLEALPL